MFSLQRSVASPLSIAAFSIVAVLVALLVSYAATAQTPEGSVSITVSPQSLDTAVNPGQSTTNVFRVTNGSDQSITIQPTPKNFVPRGNEGAIQIEEEDTPYSLAQWLSVDPGGETTIRPNQTADFEVTISVPENADPGGHFGSVVFRTLPSAQEGTAAAVSQEVAPVILVRVPGDANEDVSLTSFRALNTPIVTSDRDITLETIVKNDGNVHIKPTGTISIFNTFGQQVGSTPIDSNNVIPGAERKMNATWENPGFRFGRYTAKLTMVYGKDNKIITAEDSFFVIPLKQTIPAIIILVVASFLLYRIRHRLLLAARILAGKQEGK